jgi:hypothetical protein
MSKVKHLITTGGLILLTSCGQKADSSKAAPQNQTERSPATSQTPAQTRPEPPAVPRLDTSKIQLKGPGKVLQKEFDEWFIATEPRYFGPDNLYDLINGGSEIFIAYGFEQIVTTDYRHQGHPTVTITAEVYDMKTPLGAFGRVSKYLENLANPQDAGKGLSDPMANMGILGEGDLIFWKNRYVVHLMLMDEDPEATQDSIASLSSSVIPGIGRTIFDTIEASDPIPEVALFPLENLIPRSQSFVYDFEVGDQKINAFTARYKNDDVEWQLFITPPDYKNKLKMAPFNVDLKAAGIAEAQGLKDRVFGVRTVSDTSPDVSIIKAQLDAVQSALSKAE